MRTPLSVTITAVLAALVALSPGAFADDGDEASFSEPGFYFGASGVYVTDIFEDEVDDVIEANLGVPASVDIDPTWGVDARVGYRFGGWFATELEYEYVDDFEVDVMSLGVPIGGAGLTAHSATLNGRLILPLWRIQPFLMVGGGATVYDLVDGTPGGLLGGSRDDVGFAGRAGGGLDLYLTRHLVLNARASVLLTTQDFEAPAAGGKIDDLFYVSGMAGLEYRF